MKLKIIKNGFTVFEIPTAEMLLIFLTMSRVGENFIPRHAGETTQVIIEGDSHTIHETIEFTPDEI